ncbi:MAG: A24 family peptidase [Burkholderiales bacterium]|jgi:leader peptidase (prepilin peptidase)/N-methyltransferase
MTDLINLLQDSPFAFTTTAVVIGLMVGSFLNVVIFRLPRMMQRDWNEQAAALLEEASLGECATKLRAENDTPRNFSLVLPRSTCPKCGHQIRALENIPVVSYLFLRGKCAKCEAPISARYPIIEAISGVVTGYVAWHFGFGLAGVTAIVFAWSLIALTLIDIDTQLLPDSITLPLLWLGLLSNISATFTPLPSAVTGAAAGYLSLWSVYWIFRIVTGKEGMGFGDFKLLAAIGAWLGWKLLPLVILLSSFVGAVIGISLIVFRRHGRNVPIPFGPYLAIAGLIAMLWGERLNSVYLGLLR